MIRNINNMWCLKRCQGWSCNSQCSLTKCKYSEIENESHFALYCLYYHDLRLQLFNKAEVKKDKTGYKYAQLFDKTFLFPDFIEQAWTKRRTAL